MAHPLLPIPSDPTPTWETLCDRLALTIENLQRLVDGGGTAERGLAGPARVTVARALNQYATPLILILEDVQDPRRATPPESA